MKILAGIIIVAVLITSVAVISSLIFKGRYLSDVKAALSPPAPVHAEILTEESIASLAGPVQRYIRYTGALGNPVVRNIKITFNRNHLASSADLIYKYPSGDFCYGKFVMGSISYNVIEY